MIKLKRSERGAAALAVAMLLLFGMTLVAFFVNRSVIFEQRTSANQYRSTKAFEAAEAGLEWAISKLNEDLVIGTAPSCATGSGTQTFRERYLQLTTGANPSFNVLANVRVGCSIAANGATTCSCPTSGTPTLGATADPRFTVEFRAVTAPTADPLAVEVISYGCTNGGPNCEPGATTVSDATAVVRALLKVRPRFPTAPGAGLITGGQAVPGGNFKVVNLDIESNGITINSGTNVDLTGSTSVVTVAGTPPTASVLDNDPSLQALTTADADGNIFFTGFFGESITDYQNNPQTWLITSGSCGTRTRCTSCTGGALACGAAVTAAYNNRVSQFWADTDVAFNTSNLPSAGTLGTSALPLTMASSAEVELRSNITAYGMFYAATATATENWDYSGTGAAQVFGAFVSRGDFVKGTGTLDLIYDPDIFGRGTATGLLVRVPGSWRDKLTDY